MVHFAEPAKQSGFGVLGEGARLGSLLPTNQLEGIGERCKLPQLGPGRSRPQTHFGRRRAQKTHLMGTNFVYFQSTNMRLELQNPVDYYNKNYSTQNALWMAA